MPKPRKVRRELFRGLAIEKTDWDWELEVYPVLHLDMSAGAVWFPAVAAKRQVP